ncbi:putative zinc finger CCCH domain-containing protein 33 [Iris pallida]|uniref:Zinc finger CCCH domain-containing protein 33 n=1 Tax=Iris pallida TaxID=29817 RepID=A0AAX6EIZ0_IRIPA|nr:putative zinc finger CCCH domain-containing protein 33 [Iris pallida]
MCNGTVSSDVDVLLELSALDDLASFKLALENSHHHVALLNSFGPWYGRSAGPARRLALHDRTPLMVAALHGSAAVLAFLLSNPHVDVNLRSASDAATALQLALLSGSSAAATMLLGSSSSAAAAAKTPPPPSPKNKKEYPTGPTVPDVSSGAYSTDDFRMYGFKIKTCSRAYAHDWTECPFAHPGENARRRCPGKHAYSCVPCPDFRRAGSCRSGDACEYAHGVFESWLHPAQYRTRLCKDEAGCGRKVCFFAHGPEELRSVDLTAASVGVAGSVGAAAGQLKSSPSYRERSFGMDGYQQKLLDEMSSWPTRTDSFSAATTAAPGYSSILASLEPSVRSQLLAGYLNSLRSSSATENPMSSFGHSTANAIMNSRSAAFPQRSQSFCDRGAVARHPSAPLSPVSGPGGMGISDWGSRSGNLDWGTNGQELNRFRKSASFAFRGNRGSASPPKPVPVSHEEPDLSWVHSLVKDGPATAAPVRGGLRRTPMQYQMNGVGTGRSEMLSPWGEQMYAEIEQLVA